jgi:hypothetical protein
LSFSQKKKSKIALFINYDQFIIMHVPPSNCHTLWTPNGRFWGRPGEIRTESATRSAERHRQDDGQWSLATPQK